MCAENRDPNPCTATQRAKPASRLPSFSARNSQVFKVLLVGFRELQLVLYRRQARVVIELGGIFFALKARLYWGGPSALLQLGPIRTFEPRVFLDVSNAPG